MIIDRFEGDMAIVYDGDDIICVHRSHLPSGAGTGDSLSISGGKYQLDGKNNIEGEICDKLREMLGGSDD